MASFPPGVAELHRRLAACCALPAPSGPMSRSRSAVAVPAAPWLSPRCGGAPGLGRAGGKEPSPALPAPPGVPTALPLPPGLLQSAVPKGGRLLPSRLHLFF